MNNGHQCCVNDTKRMFERMTHRKLKVVWT